MKTYGLILADNGSNWYFQGTADRRWTYTEVDQLKAIPASQFVAVDESCLDGARRTPVRPCSPAARRIRPSAPRRRVRHATSYVACPSMTSGPSNRQDFIHEATRVIAVVDDECVETPTYRFSISKWSSGFRRRPSLQYPRSSSLPRMTPSEPSTMRCASGDVNTIVVTEVTKDGLEVMSCSTRRATARRTVGRSFVHRVDIRRL